jgi:hypothetical protein
MRHRVVSLRARCRPRSHSSQSFDRGAVKVAVASRRARWSSNRRTHDAEEARDRRRRGESHDVETRETSRCAAHLIGGLRIIYSVARLRCRRYSTVTCWACVLNGTDADAVGDPMLLPSDRRRVECGCIVAPRAARRAFVYSSASAKWSPLRSNFRRVAWNLFLIAFGDRPGMRRARTAH